MSSQPLLQDPALPLVQRDLVCRCGDTVPQRLHVVDLLLDGQLVEPRRGHRERLAHDSV
jgi:hypothetical protein